MLAPSPGASATQAQPYTVSTDALEALFGTPRPSKPPRVGQSVNDIIVDHAARGYPVQIISEVLGGYMSPAQVTAALATLAPRYVQPTPPSAHDAAVAKEVARLQVESEARRKVAAAEPRPVVRVTRRAELAALPTPAPLWAGWLYASTPAIVSAPGGVGKTALLLGLAVAVTHGLDFLGQPTRRGRVLYIAGEGQYGLDRRLRAWELHLGIPEGSTEVDVVFGHQLTPATLRQVSSIVRAGQHALVIADTYSSLSTVASENDNSEVSRFIRSWQRAIFDANPTATPLLVHHVTVTIDAQGRRRQKSRGASAFRDDHDTAILLDGTADSFRMTTEQSAAGKQKEEAPLTLDGLALRRVGPHMVVVQQDEAAQAANAEKVRRLVEMMVPGNGYTSTELQERWGIRGAGQYQALRTEAVDAGLIVKQDGHKGHYVRVA